MTLLRAEGNKVIADTGDRNKYIRFAPHTDGYSYFESDDPKLLARAKKGQGVVEVKRRIESEFIPIEEEVVVYDEQKCSALTKEKKACKRNKVEGTEYCSLHQDYELK